MSSIIRADTIQDLSGNNIINESGDTITIGASGDTTNIVGTLQNNGSAVGGANTPAFQVTAGTSSQSLSNDTWTKINLGTEVFDTDSAFSSNKFTVPSSESGKYSFTYGIAVFNIDDSETVETKLYKNGSAIDNTHVIRRATGSNQLVFAQSTQIVVLSASDYIELYGKQTEGGSQDTNYSHVFLSGYKLIGA